MSKPDPLILKYASFLEGSRGRSGATSDCYSGYLRRLDAWLLTEHRTDVFACKREALEEFCSKWAHGQGMSVRSRRPLIAAVRGFFAWMYEFEHRFDNPAQFLTYPKAGRPLPNLITRNNAEKLLLDCDLGTFVGVRDAAILSLLMATGMRLSGVALLNQEQFSTQITDAGDRVVLLRVTEKGKRERVIPVDEVAELYLMMYLAHPELIALENERLLPEGGHIMFVQVNRGNTAEHEWMGEKRRLGGRSIQRMMIRRGHRLGIDRKQLHPHALRHLFGTELAEDDVDLKRIQMMMGHASIDSTGLYLHLALRKLSGVINRSSPLAKMRTPLHDVRDQMKSRVRIEADD